MSTISTYTDGRIVEQISTKETAVLIRQTLTRVFPGVKFSVRTHSYSGGSHVNVGWVDGPGPWQVDDAVGIFCGRTFDGSDDSTHYHDTTWQGRLVSFGGSAPSCQRQVTDHDARKAQAVAIILRNCVTQGLPGQERFGNDWVDNLASNMVWSADYRQADPLAAAFRRVVLREREEDAPSLVARALGRTGSRPHTYGCQAGAPLLGVGCICGQEA